MPIALRPDKNHVTVWLASDDDLAPEVRPSFVVRHLSGDDWLDATDIRQSIVPGMTNREVDEKLNAFLKMLIVKTVNFPEGQGDVDFVLKKVLDPTNEKWQLISRILEATSLTPKKNLPSPLSPESTPECSAKDAPAQENVSKDSIPNLSLSSASLVAGETIIAQSATELAK